MTLRRIWKLLAIQGSATAVRKEIVIYASSCSFCWKTPGPYQTIAQRRSKDPGQYTDGKMSSAITWLSINEFLRGTDLLITQTYVHKEARQAVISTHTKAYGADCAREHSPI
jgi:hypothetical protein